MSDHLDRENDRNHPPDRPEKMFDVFCAMIFQADDMREHHDRQRAGQGCVEAGGRREESGYQTDQVAGENIDDLHASLARFDWKANVNTPSLSRC